MPQRGKNNRLHSHSILVSSLGDRSRYAVYQKVSDYLARGDAVIYAAEPDPVQVIDKISRIITSQHADSNKINSEVEDYIISGALTVVGSDEVYLAKYTDQFDIESIIRAWHSLIFKAKRKSSVRHKRFLLIGTVSAFLQTNNTSKLLEYEDKIRTEAPIKSIEAICWYNKPKLLARLSFSSLLSILNAHDATIHSGWSYRKWYYDTVIQYVRDGFDKVMGEGALNLIFKTLKMVYRLDKEVIFYEPELFEKKVTKIIGEQSAHVIFRSIAEKIRKEITFSNTAKIS